MTPALRLLTYNVHGLRDDVDALVGVVRELDPDVMFVQEAPRRFRWRSRCAALARRCGLLYAAGGQPALGNLLLVSHRVAVHRAWALRYPLTPGRHRRGAAFARCTVGRVPFVAVGTHLATDPVERPVQAGVLAEALAGLDDPVCLGGDLNEGPDGSAWAALARGRTDTADSGAPTYPTSRPARRIDALLLDPGWAVSGYRVVDTPAARRASDHFPVYAEASPPG